MIFLLPQQISLWAEEQVQFSVEQEKIKINKLPFAILIKKIIIKALCPPEYVQLDII